MSAESGFRERLAALDVTLFDAIRSQTTREDKVALLAIQRAVGRRRGEFAYLEIGSHLGGSIQPYLMDPACTRIWSVDPRPLSQPDDRRKRIAHYPENSTERMLENLRSVAPGQVDKLRCFESDAREVDPALIEPRPLVAFVDGEHTHSAVVSDAAFCRGVLAEGGVIVFHDFGIVSRAIFEAVAAMRPAPAVAMLVGGGVFALFFDEGVVEGDEHLSERRRIYGSGRLVRLRTEAQRATRELLVGPALRLWGGLRAVAPGGGGPR